MVFKSIFLATGLAAISSSAMAASDSQCNQTACSAGANVVTHATKEDAYFACQTKEISEYANYVLGLVTISAMLGKMPNISSETGDPEQTGESKAILDSLRKKSGARTFDDALKRCEKGRHGIKMVVANNPADSGSMWVYDPARKLNYWIPKSHADKK